MKSKKMRFISKNNTKNKIVPILPSPLYTPACLTISIPSHQNGYFVICYFVIFLFLPFHITLVMPKVGWAAQYNYWWEKKLISIPRINQIFLPFRISIIPLSPPYLEGCNFFTRRLTNHRSYNDSLSFPYFWLIICFLVHNRIFSIFIEPSLSFHLRYTHPSL